jgi:hypothetical protein
MPEENYDDIYERDNAADAERKQAQMLAEKLQGLGNRLHAQAHDNAKKRNDVENRWLEDLRQYNGKYDPADEAALAAATGSKLFVNLTRNKTNAFVARVTDILFPTDDRNWAIKPTPVPLLREMSKSEEPLANEDGTPFITEQGIQVEQRDLAQSVMDDAKEASEKMQTVIDDQLTESDYNAVARDIIHDAGVFGTGIIKGPLVLGKTRKKWTKQTDEQGNSVHVIELMQDLNPSCERVDPWDFFPDMTARRLSDCEFIFQRHSLTNKALRALAQQPGFMTDQIAAVLKMETDPSNTATHLAELRAISGLTDLGNKRHEVWEYHGPIDKDDLEACGFKVDGEDPLQVLNGVIWFTEKHVIKAQINPMDTEELPYSVFNIETDDASLFGPGIPRLMRNSQQVMCATWRMTMDNAGLSSGDQIVISNEIEPVDGRYEITPKKLWSVKPNSNIRSVHEAFGSFPINSHTGELLGLFEAARQLADEETAMPQIAQGEQGTATDTATGMSLLMGSANTMLRRVIKNFDDEVTRPMIKRFYDWNMQYHPDEEIKGDYNVDPRGSSSLMVKERQAQMVAAFTNMAASLPQFNERTDWDELYDAVVKSAQLDSNVALPKEEIEANKDRIIQQLQQKMMAMQQQGAGQGDPLAGDKLQLQAQKQQQDGELKAEQLQQAANKQATDKDLAVLKIQSDQDKQNQNVKAKLAEMQLKREVGSGI